LILSNGNAFMFVPFPNSASLLDQILPFLFFLFLFDLPKLWLLPLLPITSFWQLDLAKGKKRKNRNGSLF